MASNAGHVLLGCACCVPARDQAAGNRRWVIADFAAVACLLLKIAGSAAGAGHACARLLDRGSSVWLLAGLPGACRCLAPAAARCICCSAVDQALVNGAARGLSRLTIL